jgi:hypothetical protein
MGDIPHATIVARKIWMITPCNWMAINVAAASAAMRRTVR